MELLFILLIGLAIGSYAYQSGKSVPGPGPAISPAVEANAFRGNG